MIEIKTSKDSYRLLKILKNIEVRLGRTKEIKWGPRVIDLDILLFGEDVVFTENLIIPHPEMIRRKFVLVPFVEINSEAYHPIVRESIGAIWQRVSGEIRKQKVEMLEKFDIDIDI